MHWRTPITLAVLVVILLGAAYYGWRTVVDPVTGADSPSTPTRSQTSSPPPKQVCVKKLTYPKGAVIPAASFTVNVYNASAVSGRAGDVLAALHGNGFRLGVAANPPATITSSNVTILTSTPTSPRVQLVKEQFKGLVKLLPGPSLAVGIDIVIGPSFAGLNPQAPSSLTVTRATTICTEFTTK